MSDRIQIFGSVYAMHPKALLTRRFKVGVIAFGLGAQSVNLFECHAFPVYGKPVIIGNCNVFCAAAVFPAVVPVFVVAGQEPDFDFRVFFHN